MSDVQALSTAGYVKASRLVLDWSMEVKVRMTSRWKPSAERRWREALKDFVVVEVNGGADGFGTWM